MATTSEQWRIGIDLGGTKSEVILLNGQSKECFRTRISTVRDDYAATIDAIAHLVGLAEQAAGVAQLPVGVGIPGTISRKTGLVKNANSTWINGKPLQNDLSNRLQREVKITNDANCLAVSEATDGAGRGYNLVFAAILGTGCGAGLAYGGQAIVGPNGVAGEWGHNVLPWSDPKAVQARPCYCGKYGCTETFLSGPGLSHTYQNLTNEKLNAEAIAQRFLAGEPAARDAITFYTDGLARGLAGVINILDPDVIVLGGGVSSIEHLYAALPELLPNYVFGGECDTPVVKAVHGDSSGVRGAAWLNPL